MAKVKLVEDWRKGWRWASVQLMGLSAAVQFGASALPPWLHDRVPDAWWKYIAGGILVAAIAARFIQQELGEAATAQPESPNDEHP